MRILFVLRGCIAVELQGPARFAKLHSEIMNVVRGSVDLTCYAGIRKDKKKHMYNAVANQRSSVRKTFDLDTLDTRP